QLRQAVEREQRQLERQVRVLSLREEPGPAELAAFGALAQQSEGRITSLQAQLREAERAPDRVPDLRALHERLTRTDLRAVFAGLDWAHDDGHCAAVRALLLDAVSSAVLMERRPSWHSTWLRVEVTWSAAVQELLAVGALTL